MLLFAQAGGLIDQIGGIFNGMSITQIGILVVVGYMFITGKIKISDLLNILNTSPTPTPVPTPGPAPVDPNNPNMLLTLLQLLLNLKAKANLDGNKDLEDGVDKTIANIVTPK